MIPNSLFQEVFDLALHLLSAIEHVSSSVDHIACTLGCTMDDEIDSLAGLEVTNPD